MDILEIKKKRILDLQASIAKRELFSKEIKEKTLFKVNQASIEHAQKELDQLILETKGN